MNNNVRYYTGKLTDHLLTYEGRPDPYLPDDRLVKAIQFAQALGKPLLLKGEPGSGKTKVAEAIAYELFGPAYKNYYFEWPVKSTSKAQDGLYTINYLQRLQDAGIRENEEKKSLTITLEENEVVGNYIELGELGKAFRITNLMAEQLPPPVVLIDEIDKADIDFPNDLLMELERMEFRIPEAKTETGAPVIVGANKNRKPLIIITSNDEKPLPPAFLRRCLFYYIEFPGPEALFRIVESRNFPRITRGGLLAISRLFSALRYAIEREGTASKNITTSELLDWLLIIDIYYRGNEALFDVESTESVNEFLKKYSSALAKDDATRLMIEDTRKSGTFIGNTLEMYRKYENQDNTIEPENRSL